MMLPMPIPGQIAEKPQSEAIQGLEVALRCECGETVAADSEKHLVKRARRHFREAHPALGSVPAEQIIAMAEKRQGVE